MTETTSATCRTIARSCEISSRLRDELAREVDEQVRELRLRRGVERRERLVEHDHRRVGRERAGDRDPLPLPAAELVRKATGRGRREPDELEQLRDAGAPSARGAMSSASSASASCAPTFRRGFSDEYGFWKTIWRPGELARPRAAA